MNPEHITTTAPFSLPDLLPFRLPPFNQIGWVSNAAEATWRNRLFEAAKAWEYLEFSSVRLGLRQAALLENLPERDVPLGRIQIVELDSGQHTWPGPPMSERVWLVADRSSIPGFLHAWEVGDSRTIGRLLGYPECCIEQFEATYKSEEAIWNPVWNLVASQQSITGLQTKTSPSLITLNAHMQSPEQSHLPNTEPGPELYQAPLTHSGLQTPHLSGMSQSNRESQSGTGAHAHSLPPSDLNTLLTGLGLRNTPHIPCSPQCKHSQKIAEDWAKAAHTIGLEKEMAMLQEILSWPMSWTALHGIAEVKTPVFRFSRDTAATGNKYTIHYEGQGWPEEGATGLEFPYRKPEGKRIVRGNKSWAAGIANPIENLEGEQLEDQFTFLNRTKRLLPEIDWAKVAIPQADGYDTTKILECARVRFGYEAPQKHITPQTPATPQANSSKPEQGHPKPQTHTSSPFFAEVVHIREECPLGEEFIPGPLSHPIYEQTERLLQTWPEGYQQCKAFIKYLQPSVYKDLPEEEWHTITGSCSHCFEDEFGTVYATVHDPIALAQALVHEMAHKKLFALGFWKEHTGHLITNPLHEAYPGTIRTDKPRPVSALIHAQYSFIHVIALDLKILKAGILETEAERNHLLGLLHRNLFRMDVGHQTLEQVIKTDENGKAFLGTFMNWSAEMIEAGKAHLAELSSEA